MKTTFHKLSLILQDIFDLTASQISNDTSKEDLSDWDSLSNIRLALSIEKSFNIHLSAMEISNINTIEELCNLIDEKK